jgi:hypothetical protein
MAVSKRFGRFKDEDEKAVRKVEVKRDKVLEKLVDAWGKYPYDKEEGVGSAVLKVLLVIRGIRYSSKDVEKFSLALGEFQHEKDFEYKAGIFLTALIIYGRGGEYTVHTGHLDKKINWLGAGTGLGGAAAKSIIINGDVGNFLGADMAGGKITVNGDAGHEIGHFMSGGMIELNGGRGSLGVYVGGKIYHHGELISG